MIRFVSILRMILVMIDLWISGINWLKLLKLIIVEKIMLVYFFRFVGLGYVGGLSVFC